MTKIEHVMDLLTKVDYEGKMKKDVDRWIAEQAQCSVSLVQKLRMGFYPYWEHKTPIRLIVKQQNQAMASKWKAPKRIR